MRRQCVVADGAIELDCGLGPFNGHFTQLLREHRAHPCQRLHVLSQLVEQERGIDLSSHSGVLRTLTPGNANSLLIQVTRPGGLMYSNFRSTPAEKVATIQKWIVDFNATQ